MGMTFEEWWRNQDVNLGQEDIVDIIKAHARLAWQQGINVGSELDVKIKNIQITPNSIVSITLPDDLDMDTLNSIKNSLRDTCVGKLDVDGVSLVFIPRSFTLDCVGGDKMNGLGWFRKGRGNE